MTYRVERYHDISCGHRVYGHESKCANLHGHNYRITFYCTSAPNMEELDRLGRVIDFSEIKSRLCMWLEDNWDHKMLIWKNDPDATLLKSLDKTVVITPFNPTAENMAEYLVKKMAPLQLDGTGIQLSCCKVEETRKCAASYSL